mgnify:CR=1 FL=1
MPAGRPRSFACRSARSSSTVRTCRSIPTWSSRKSSRAASLRAGATSSICGSSRPLPIGLSREHDWAPGTLALSIQNFVALLRDLARNIVRALPARNLAIVNGHGGNRGVLDNLIHELRGDFALNACVIHPFDLAKVDVSADRPRCSWRQERDLGDAGAGAAAGAARRNRTADSSARRRRHRGVGLRPRGELSVAHRRSAPHRERRHRRGPCRLARNSGRRSSAASSRRRAACSGVCWRISA